MAEIVTHILDARDNATINVYAVRYYQREREKNVAVALPGNMNYELRSNFCENVQSFQDYREVAFDPIVDGLEDGTYEYIPVGNIEEKWNEIVELIDRALDYNGRDSRRKVPFSNLYICALDYEGHRYYLCSKQDSNSDKLLRGKFVLTTQQDELRIAPPSEVFIVKSYVGFIVDTVEEKVIIFDKKAFQEILKYDEYQKEKVQRELSRIDAWSFLASTELIKQRSSQKNVYINLAKVFSDDIYMGQISHVSPAQLKRNLLTNSPENFREDDFDGDKLVVTQRNLETVMKMLAKRFKFNFFTNIAE